MRRCATLIRVKHGRRCPERDMFLCLREAFYINPDNRNEHRFASGSCGSAHGLHEIKHDGHRLIAIVPARGKLKLLSRNGHDRTALFRGPFRELVAQGRAMVLDGEIAVPDERGVTHIDLLQDAFGSRGADRLTYFAFDLLYLDEHDRRRCPIEERKALLQQVSTKPDATGYCLPTAGVRGSHKRYTLDEYNERNHTF